MLTEVSSSSAVKLRSTFNCDQRNSTDVKRIYILEAVSCLLGPTASQLWAEDIVASYPHTAWMTCYDVSKAPFIGRKNNQQTDQN